RIIREPANQFGVFLGRGELKGANTEVA
ncbi:MAG: hypothetical protein ACJAXA_002361, partial [Candidatus Aldehydirespiratoraceae bacterium]